MNYNSTSFFTSNNNLNGDSYKDKRIILPNKKTAHIEYSANIQANI